jgi:hypothetical protein
MGNLDGSFPLAIKAVSGHPKAQKFDRRLSTTSGKGICFEDRRQRLSGKDFVCEVADGRGSRNEPRSSERVVHHLSFIS